MENVDAYQRTKIKVRIHISKTLWMWSYVNMLELSLQLCKIDLYLKDVILKNLQ